eukprot:7176569-Pyramimonas_sp.AAC.1
MQDSPKAANPAEIDPFASMPVDATIPADSGPPDLDSFFGFLPTQGNHPVAASSLDDIFGPGPQPSRPAARATESVDDLFTKMNIGPSKPAPARDTDGFTANLSALYGGHPPAAAQLMHQVGDLRAL